MDNQNLLRTLDVNKPNTILKESNSLPFKAWLAAGVRMPDGSVLVCGGDYRAPVRDCTSINPVSLATTTAPSLPVAVGGQEMVLVDSDVYSLGGSTNGQVSGIINRVHRLRGGNWTPMTSMNAVRLQFAAVLVDNFIYAIGGLTTDGSPQASVEALDLISGVWSGRAALPRPRRYHVGAVYQEQIWVCGGWRPPRSKTATCVIYNPATNSWTFGPTMQHARNDFGLFVSGGYLHAVGGYFDEAKTVERLNPDRRNWELIPGRMKYTAKGSVIIAL